MINNNNEYKKPTNNTCRKLIFGWTLKNQCFSNAEKLCKLGLNLYLIKNHRICHKRCTIRKGVYENFAKFTGKHLGQSLFFNKGAGDTPATLLKK